ncbi:testicular haploid expressed gene protein-like isoform X2 [Pomacea canaliculata]|uniref:testicular haploid expressed gene protein-like isoform X2 n=1 Tax=Pomacea canaliculata TaxID=400727 RepID=UPI000D7284AC|nr:testicular haploid expressed gene protein-like isoform X2 [Pomacea canaliculata]
MTAGHTVTNSNREFGEYDSDTDEKGQVARGDRKRGEYERIREKARDRLQQLAKHREPQIQPHTCVGPSVMWGTQQMIWPVSPHALSGQASPRVQYLATPKRNFQEGTIYENRPLFFYSSGRSSVLWPTSNAAKQGSATERITFLAQHKNFHPDWKEDRQQFWFSCGRDSPLWKVKQAAMQAGDRPRTTALAEHQPCHKDYQPEKPIQSIVTEAALNARPSVRIQSLAAPKDRPEGPFRSPEWAVTDSAKAAMASARCTELARAKPLAEGFQPAREIEWPVSKAARRAQATGRITELARPVTRATMDHLQFNPDAFTVKQSALKGGIPQRIEELAQPVQR